MPHKVWFLKQSLSIQTVDGLIMETITLHSLYYCSMEMGLDAAADDDSAQVINEN